MGEKLIHYKIKLNMFVQKYKKDQKFKKAAISKMKPNKNLLNRY